MALPNVYVLVFTCTCGVMLGVGLVANLLVFSLFANANRVGVSVSVLRRSRLDVLLLSMTLADFLSLLLVPFTLQAAVSGSWALGDASCKVYQFLLAFSLAASVYSLCAVSVARAMVVTNPYRPPPMDLLVLMAVLAWALSFFISLPLRMFATKEEVEDASFCLPTIHQHHYQVVLSQFVLYYFLPMLVIAFNYIRLALFLHRSPVMSESSLRNTRRASLMVFLAASTFSACWLPGYVLELCVYLGQYRPGRAWELFYFTCTVLQHLHPCINPLLYVLLSKRHRRAAWTWSWTCSKTRTTRTNRVQPQVISTTTDTF